MKLFTKFLIISSIVVLMGLSYSNGYLLSVQAQTIHIKGSINFEMNQISVGQQDPSESQGPPSVNGSNGQQGSHPPTGPLGSLDAPVPI